jgi:hypothetical protein
MTTDIAERMEDSHDVALGSLLPLMFVPPICCRRGWRATDSGSLRHPGIG